MGQYNYSPKIDLVFRKLFGSEDNKDLLLSLINGIIDCTPRLTDLTLKNPYNLATYLTEKTSILDVKAVDEHGTWYDIEMQIGEYGFYGKRALYYLSKMYVDQLKEAEGYATLKTTIGIHLIDFDYFPDERYRHRYLWKDADTNEALDHLNYQQLYFIEMRKFRKEWTELASLLDRWIAFLNKAEDLEHDDVPSALQSEPEIVKAISRLEVMYFEAKEREIYEAELKARLDEIEKVRTALVKGEGIGFEKGEAVGLEKGEAIGIEIGIARALQRLRDNGISEEEARRILGIE